MNTNHAQRMMLTAQDPATAHGALGAEMDIAGHACHIRKSAHWWHVTDDQGHVHDYNGQWSWLTIRASMADYFGEIDNGS